MIFSARKTIKCAGKIILRANLIGKCVRKIILRARKVVKCVNLIDKFANKTTKFYDFRTKFLLRLLKTSHRTYFHAQEFPLRQNLVSILPFRLRIFHHIGHKGISIYVFRCRVPPKLFRRA